MSEAHADQMIYLLMFIGLLLTIIVGVVIGSQFRKDKKTESTETQLTRNPSEIDTEKVHDILTQVEKNTQAGMPAYVPPVALPKPVHEVESDLKSALKKTEENFFGRIRKAFRNADKKAVLEEVEEILYTSDLGPATVQKLLDVIDSELSSKEMKDIDAVKAALKGEMIGILKDHHTEETKQKPVAELIRKAVTGPTVLMVVGVNGAGKTTSIGKITAQLASQNYKVLVAAGDTFRAAAGGQLKEWTSRAQAEIFWPENVTDPSAVAFDAVSKAKAQNFDFVILDTAGRLHTQGHLMEELKKVKRVMAKVIPEAPHETWIVLDANSGQNALMQAKEFNQALGLTGVVMTKMDGTAKGGVALGVVDQIHIPIKLIGIGEKINDLKSFNYQEYVDSILGV